MRLKIQRRIKSLALGLALSFGLLEISFRLLGIGAWEDTRFSFEDPDRPPFKDSGCPGIHAQVPNPGSQSLLFGQAVRINAEGFRGASPSEQDGTRLRILALGDSWTYGWGVGELQTWPAQLESALQGRGSDARVYNLGVPGMDTEQEAIWLKARGPALDPQALVLGFNIDDVLSHEDAWLKAYRDSGACKHKEAEAPDWGDALKHACKRHSWTYRWASDRWHRARRASVRTVWQGPSQPYMDHLRQESRPGTMTRRRWESSLEEILAFCRQRHCALVVVVFPRLEEPDLSRYRLEDLHRPIHEVLDGLPGVRVLEALDVLERKDYRAEDLTLQDRGHPQAWFYARLGQTCAEALLELRQEMVGR